MMANSRLKTSRRCSRPELKTRENGLEQKLNQAKEKAKSGDNNAAIPIFRSVYEEKCLFPKKAKEAAKELKKLGVNDLAAIADPPIFEKLASARSSARC